MRIYTRKRERKVLRRLRLFPLKEGFTLIEVVLFIVLVGIFMSTIVATFGTSVVGMERPEIVAMAMFLAKEKLEQLQPQTYSAIQDEPRASIGGPYAAFEREVRIILIDANLSPAASDVGYKKVTVTVYHPQLPSSGLSVESLFTDYKS